MATPKELIDDISSQEIDRVITENGYETWSYYFDTASGYAGIMGANNENLGLYYLSDQNILKPGISAKINQGNFEFNNDELTLRITTSEGVTDLALFNDKSIITSGENVSRGPLLDAELKKTLEQWSGLLNSHHSEPTQPIDSTQFIKSGSYNVRYMPWLSWVYSKAAILDINNDSIEVRLKTSGKVLLSSSPSNVSYSFSGLNFLLLADNNNKKRHVRLMFSKPSNLAVSAMITVFLISIFLLYSVLPFHLAVLLLVTFVPVGGLISKNEADSISKSGVLEIIKHLNTSRKLHDAEYDELERAIVTVGRRITVVLGGMLFGLIAGFLVWYKLFSNYYGKPLPDLSPFMEWSFVAIPAFISAYAINLFFRKQKLQGWIILTANFTILPLLYGYILRLII